MNAIMQISNCFSDLQKWWHLHKDFWGSLIVTVAELHKYRFLSIAFGDNEFFCEAGHFKSSILKLRTNEMYNIPK